MSKGMPSMMALLGLLAVAGYQNRDKLGEMMSDAGQPQPGARDSGSTASKQSNQSGVLSEIAALFGGASAGGALADGLRGLLDQFRNAGQSATADSWVSTGANQDLQPDQLAATLGDGTIAELTQKTGLTRSDVLARLSSAIPEAVDRFTPEGRIPTETEAQNFI